MKYFKDKKLNKITKSMLENAIKTVGFYDFGIKDFGSYVEVTSDRFRFYTGKESFLKRYMEIFQKEIEKYIEISKDYEN